MNQAGPNLPADGTRVLVVADDHLVRAGLSALLEEQPGATVAGQASTDEMLSAGPDVFRADVAVWDLGWDPDLGLGPVVEFQDHSLPTVVLLSDEALAPPLWAAGVRGLLDRDVDGEVLAGALAVVSSGLAVVDPRFSVTSTDPERAESPAPASGITPRELDVLSLMAEGMPNKAIASSLGVSEHTVKFHVNAILGKLGARSRTEAVTIATRAGLLTL